MALSVVLSKSSGQVVEIEYVFLYILLPVSQLILKMILSNSSPGFLMVFQKCSLDIGCFYSFSVQSLYMNHFQINVYF